MLSPSRVLPAAPHELQGCAGTSGTRARCVLNPCPPVSTVCHDAFTQRRGTSCSTARERCESKLSEETSSDVNPRTAPLFAGQWEPGLAASAGVPDTAVLPEPAPARRSGQRRRRPKISIPGVLVVAGIIGSGVLVTEWPPARWLVYAAWMMPMLELALLVARADVVPVALPGGPGREIPARDHPGHHEGRRVRPGQRNHRPDQVLSVVHGLPDLGGPGAGSPHRLPAR